MTATAGARSVARDYRVDVQGLRGVAVLIVVLFHARVALPGGFVGVDVFFAISGFVIGRLLLAEAERSGRISLRDFYARRARRLIPALGATLATVSVVSVLVLAPAFPQPNALKTALAASFSVANLFLWVAGGGYFSPVDEQNPFVHTWSLGVEEQFYVLLPVLVAALCWWAARRAPQRGPDADRRRRRLITAALVAVAVASFAGSIVWTFGVTPLGDIVPKADLFAFYGSVTRVWEFVAGVLLAIWMSRRSARRPLPASVLGVGGMIGIGMIVVAALAFSPRTPFPGVAAAVPVIGAVLVMGAGAGPAARLLSLRPLVWLGDRSYSWYLWHWPFIVLLPVIVPNLPAAAPVAALVALGPAVLSYRFLEQRYRASRDRPVRSTVPRLLGTWVAVPVLVAVIGLLGATRTWGLETHPELQASSVSQDRHCFEAATPVDRCTFEGGERGTVMLVGDSHADVISDPVIEAATDAGYDVVVQTFLSCPFVSRPLEFDQDCAEREAQTTALIESMQPDVVVIANNSPLAVAKLGDRQPSDDPAPGAVDEWERAVHDTIVDVRSSTEHIVLFETVPAFDTDVFDLALPTLARRHGTFPTMSAEEVTHRREAIVAAETAAVAGFGDLVTVVDATPQLCPDGCALRDPDGSFRYRDPNHLAPATAATLADTMAEALFVDEARD